MKNQKDYSHQTKVNNFPTQMHMQHAKFLTQIKKYIDKMFNGKHHLVVSH